MSSYISGVYDLVAGVAEAIHNQAMQELRIAQQELHDIYETLSANEQAQQALRNEQQQRENQRRQAEHTLNESVAERRQKADTIRRAMQEEAVALLSAAREQLAYFNDAAPEKKAFLEKIGCYENSLTMFGVTAETVDAMKRLTRTEIPHAISEAFRREETARLEQMAQDHLRVHGTVTDRSLHFVSLNMQEGHTQKPERPWDIFVKRVQTLVQQQQKYGSTKAKELLQSMEALAPAEQSRFILQHRALLQQWEKEAETFNASTDLSEKQHALYVAYSILYDTYPGQLPCEKLGADAEYDQLQYEYDRLCSAYIAQRKQQYIEHAFREVLEAHGLVFESMNTDGRRNVQIEFSMGEDCGIRVMRSASGAFDMVFYGISNESSVSLDQRRKIAENAHRFCSMMPSIADALQQRGISFQQRLTEEPEEAEITFEYRPFQAKTYDTQQMNYLKRED